MFRTLKLMHWVSASCADAPQWYSRTENSQPGAQNGFFCRGPQPPSPAAPCLLCGLLYDVVIVAEMEALLRLNEDTPHQG